MMREEEKDLAEICPRLRADGEAEGITLSNFKKQAISSAVNLLLLLFLFYQGLSELNLFSFFHHTDTPIFLIFMFWLIIMIITLGYILMVMYCIFNIAIYFIVVYGKEAFLSGVKVKKIQDSKPSAIKTWWNKMTKKILDKRRLNLSATKTWWSWLTASSYCLEFSGGEGQLAWLIWVMRRKNMTFICVSILVIAFLMLILFFSRFSPFR